MARATGWPTFRWRSPNNSGGRQSHGCGRPSRAGHARPTATSFGSSAIWARSDLHSLAYTVGQGYGVFSIPFGAIWESSSTKLRSSPTPSRPTRASSSTVPLMLFMLGVSLFVRPLFALFLPGEYMAAVPLIPIVCLAFVFPTLHDHFRVPALLAKKTVSMLLAFATGAVANVVLNLLVVPKYGAVGAAWTSVATYALFSGVGLLRYRQIDRYVPAVAMYARPVGDDCQLRGVSAGGRRDRGFPDRGDRGADRRLAWLGGRPSASAAQRAVLTADTGGDVVAVASAGGLAEVAPAASVDLCHWASIQIAQRA